MSRKSDAKIELYGALHATPHEELTEREVNLMFDLCNDPEVREFLNERMKNVMRREP